MVRDQKARNEGLPKLWASESSVTVKANLRSLVTLKQGLVRLEEAELGPNLQALYAPTHKCVSSSTLRFLKLLHLKRLPVSVLHMHRSHASLSLPVTSTEVLGKKMLMPISKNVSRLLKLKITNHPVLEVDSPGMSA